MPIQANAAPRVGEGDWKSVVLGASTSAKFTDADINKAVKLINNDRYGPVTAGDELEAVVESIEPHTVNSGYSFGTIKQGGRLIAKVDNATVTLGALVVAGAQSALGTAQDNVIVRGGTPTKFIWRVIDLLTGAGAVGSLVVIEAVTGYPG